ncbi:MAG: glycoside hydrolase family 13 protein [Defluviitaleaceae bacterium]|nr:glycoside hydrolase family 13 protein [Defluviitaleaceae bacterium]
MHLQHQSSLPFATYDGARGQVILKLITDAGVTAARVIYGDPFMYVPTDTLASQGNKIWECQYSPGVLTRQYATDDTVMWHVVFDPPKTRRLKYAFIVTGPDGREVYYSENGQMPFTPASNNLPHNHFFIPFIHDIDALRAPEWAAEVVWYQIFPDRFYNGDPSITPAGAEDWETGAPKHRNFFGGDLRGIIEKLPYLQRLGITGLYMTPVFKAPSNHKYDIADYFEIDPHFGTLADLKELVQKAHAMGMKVMLDAVFNHIGSQHAFWQDVLQNQEKSKYAGYFHIHSFPVKETYDRREDMAYDTFAFTTSMPKWNTENPDARQHLIDAALYWIKECDIDGWRLDVSDEVSFDFWHDFRKAIEAVKPDFYVLGEIWHDPSKWLNGKYFDAVMNYPLGRVIRDMFLTKTIMADKFNRELVGKLMKFSDLHSRVQFNLMDSHDTARVLTQADGDKLALKNAFLFMFMMKGAPCVYYGTEVGMEGAGDPDCRRPMLWNAAKQDLDLQDFFVKLIALRREYNELVQNADMFYTQDGELCRWRLTYAGRALEIVYNAGKTHVPLRGAILLSTVDGAPGLLPAGACAVVGG